MIKPKKLCHGDKVAIVSLSSGMAGDTLFRHRYELGKKRLIEEFGLSVVEMSSTLMGSDYVKANPQQRAEDLMEAFKNPDIKAIFCTIGGDDTIRILPYIDYEVIKNNPKIFIGYSDTTVNHFMMYKAGLVSYYGPCVLCEFAENGKIHDYTKKYIMEVLFENKENIVIESSPKWTSEFLDWCNEDNNNVFRKMNEEMHGYEIIQGDKDFEGILLGGCLDVFQMFIGTSIWPSIDEWKGKILYLETSEDKVEPVFIEYFLRNIVAQGIIDVISGIIVGKPKDETYYEEYKEVYKRIIGEEAGRKDLPILYNFNIGHTAPISILPNGIKVKVNIKDKQLKFLEKPMED